MFIQTLQLYPISAIGRLDLDSGDLHSAKLHLEEALDIQTKCVHVDLFTQTLPTITSC